VSGDVTDDHSLDRDRREHADQQHAKGEALRPIERFPTGATDDITVHRLALRRLRGAWPLVSSCDNADAASDRSSFAEQSWTKVSPCRVRNCA
jgi:hypothetical protein